jgi:hypothetical protein
MGLTNFPYGVQASPVIGANVWDIFSGSSSGNANTSSRQNIFFVDGDNGNDGNDGVSPSSAKLTIGGALAKSVAGAVIYVKAKSVSAGGTDPSSYAETFTIGASQFGTKIIGVPSGTAQGAQPQIKKGSGSTAAITVKAPGCLIQNITINMAGSTGGGILLDDDGSTMTAFGTIVKDCVFKGNANKTSGQGAVCWASTGGAWQCLISGCHFVDCTTGINILGTSQAVPKDIVIENCLFYSFANTDVDADVMFNAGSGAKSVVIRDCVFGTVDVPAKSGGDTARYLDLTQVVDSALVGCTFACIGQGTSAKTFGASGTGALIPATVRMAGNYGEVGATATTGEILRT